MAFGSPFIRHGRGTGDHLDDTSLAQLRCEQSVTARHVPH